MFLAAGGSADKTTSRPITHNPLRPERSEMSWRRELLILVDSLGADMRVFGLVTCLFASRYRLLNTENFSSFCWDKQFNFSVFILFSGNNNFANRCQRAFYCDIISVCRLRDYCTAEFVHKQPSRLKELKLTSLNLNLV
jgi:hypothetical protein